MKNQGKQYTWVGYAVKCAVGIYNLINPTTKMCIASRVVIFLKNTHGEWTNLKEPLILSVMTSVFSIGREDGIYLG